MTIRQICIFTCLLSLSMAGTAQDEANQRGQYEWIKQLQGNWVLAPADQQVGKATRHKAVAPLVGTDTIAMTFKVIGKGSTVQENLLPGTAKEMATMYHCNDVSCSKVEAKHYCVKQNQPELIVDPASMDSMLKLDCDMRTDLCNSRENHIHRITHELSTDGDWLKTTYTSYADGKYLKDSVYYFERKQ